LLDEAGDRLHRAAGREDVVVDSYAGAASDRAGCDLEAVLAVLERVRGGDRLRRELARPSRSDEAATGLDGDRSTEPEAAGLDDLQTLAELSQELSQLLFWRDLRQLASS